jgi:hypothetical protein
MQSLGANTTKMKNLFLVNLLLLISSFSFGQTPSIESNANFVEGSTPDFLFMLRDNYDFVIAYQEEGYWGNSNVIYQVLALRNGKWHYITQGKNNKKSLMPRMTSKKIDNDLGNNLLDKLNQISFWSLSSDSLNIRTRKIDDSTSTLYSRTDGVNYRFEIFTKGDYRVIQAYEPDYYLEKIPEVVSRETFVDARKAFKDLLKKIGT